MSSPLRDLKVVVTRPAGKAEHLMRLLRKRGADPIHFPTIAILDPISWGEVDAAAERLARGEYDWIVFTSVNAVEKFLNRVTSLEGLKRTRIAAVGSATQQALSEKGIATDLVPEEYTGESVAAGIGSTGGRVLLPRVQGAPREIVIAFERNGWDVDEVIAYRNDLPESSSEFPAAFDAITFASGSAARNLATMVGVHEQRLDTVDGSRLVVCIGPKTAAEAERAGLKVDVIAAVHTDEGMVSALEDHLSG